MWAAEKLDDIREVWELLPAAWADAYASLRRYWWFVLIPVAVFAVTTAIEFEPHYAAYLRMVTENIGPQPSYATASGRVICAVVLGWFWLLLYARAMHIVEPRYRLTGPGVRRIVIYYAGMILIIIGSWVPGIAAYLLLHWTLTGSLLTVLGGLVVSIRFAFTLFAIEFYEHPFRYSWRQSGGAALIPIASVYTAQAIIMTAIPVAMAYVWGALRETPYAVFTIASGLTEVALQIAIFVSVAIMIPWTMRIMVLYDDALQPEVEEGASGGGS